MSRHDLSDPVTIAAVLVRDHLDTVVARHGQGTGPVSAAVVQLVSALLEHLPGEAKQARTERT